MSREECRGRVQGRLRLLLRLRRPAEVRQEVCDSRCWSRSDHNLGACQERSPLLNTMARQIELSLAPVRLFHLSVVDELLPCIPLSSYHHGCTFRRLHGAGAEGYRTSSGQYQF